MPGSGNYSGMVFKMRKMYSTSKKHIIGKGRWASSREYLNVLRKNCRLHSNYQHINKTLGRYNELCKSQRIRSQNFLCSALKNPERKQKCSQKSAKEDGSWFTVRCEENKRVIWMRQKMSTNNNRFSTKSANQICLARKLVIESRAKKSKICELNERALILLGTLNNKLVLNRKVYEF